MAWPRPTDGDLRRPNAIESWAVEAGVLRVDLGGPTLTVCSTATGVLRVRFSPDGRPGPTRPWAVVGDQSCLLPLAADDHDDRIRVEGAGVGADIGRTGTVDVLTSDGTVFDADAEGPSWQPDGAVAWTRRMPEGRHYYGLGERTGPLDRRGRCCTCWTVDQHEDHGPRTDEMSVAVPFFVVLAPGGDCHGVYLNSSWRSQVDLTDLMARTMTISSDGPELDLFFFAGPSPARVLDRYTALTGRPALHPRWALGYHQARWSYSRESEVRYVAEELRRRRMPADVIGVDIDQMDGYRVFTWDPERFPDPAGMIDDLAHAGFKVTTVVDPGVRVDPGYPVYDEGAAEGRFLADDEGETFTGIVWPGPCAFPDFACAEVRAWWGGWHARLTDVGVQGVVNDMNEPSLRDRPLDEPAAERVEMPDELVHRDAGHHAAHREVHNLYGLLQARAAAEGLRRLRPRRRSFVVSRSGFAGVQRHAAVWTGDNGSHWEHLRMTVPQLVGLGLSGVPMAGADVGGFWDTCDPELLVRWMQAAALQPFMRSNNAQGMVPQEPWVWGTKVEEACRAAIELRYRLLPYLYTSLAESHRTGTPMLRPVWWHDPTDPVLHELDDQALVGPDLLTAPVLQPGVRARAVYLPAGRWFDWHRGDRYQGPGWVLVDAPLDGPSPLFARGGSIVPMGPLLQWSDERPLDELVLHVFRAEDGRAGGELYEDDGTSFAHEQGEHAVTRFAYDGATLRSTRVGRYRPPSRMAELIVHHHDGTAETTSVSV